MEPLLDKLEKYLTGLQHAGQSAWRSAFLFVARVVLCLARDIAEGQITLRAMSLVFTTLLAIVPLLAVSFSVMKGFGVHNQLEPLLLQFMQPLGEKGVEISEKVIGFVENIRVGVLGSLGFVLLFYSAVSLIQKVEGAFNYIWHLKQSRTLLRRFSDYLSVMFIGPVLMFAAVGLSASLMSHAVVQGLLAIEPFGLLYKTLVKMVPYLLIIAAFTFFYMFIPNTRVKFKAALCGGFISGIVWQTTGWLFASFVVASTKYTAIYSGFAILILFMIWVYLNWLILLLGANLVYYLQYPERTFRERQPVDISILDKERLALQIIATVGRAFYAGRQGVMVEVLAGDLNYPESIMHKMLELLEQAGLLTENSAGLYVPAKPFDNTTVRQALIDIRSVPNGKTECSGEHFEMLNRLLDSAETPVEDPLSRTTLKGLVEG